MKDILISFKNSLLKNCPNCKKGNIFSSYLKLVYNCKECNAPISKYKADDGPAWATMMVVGHLFFPLIISVELKYNPSLWLSLTLWPLLCAVSCLWFLPVAKTYFVHRLFNQDNDE